MQNKGELKLKILDNIYKYYIKIHGTVSEFTKKKLTLGRIYCKIGQTTQNQKGVHMKLVKSGFWNDVTVMFNVQLFVVKWNAYSYNTWCVQPMYYIALMKLKYSSVVIVDDNW